MKYYLNVYKNILLVKNITRRFFMLEELNLVNGELDYKFDKYIQEYTVSVDEDITSLSFDIKVSEGYNYRIVDNNLDSDVNMVFIEVFNDTTSQTYTFKVYKNISKTTSSIEEYKKALEVPPKEVSNYEIIGIATTCFFIILMVFVILFHRKKAK